MIIYLNDNPVEVRSNLTIADLVSETGHSDRKGIAVAVGSQVIPRTNWDQYRLSENDKVMVITATQGG